MTTPFTRGIIKYIFWFKELTMKNLRNFFLLLALVLSLSLLVACNEEEPEPEASGDPYLTTYGENFVDYDELS